MKDTSRPYSPHTATRKTECPYLPICEICVPLRMNSRPRFQPYVSVTPGPRGELLLNLFLCLFVALGVFPPGPFA